MPRRSTLHHLSGSVFPDDVARTIYPFDDYRLEFSHVGHPAEGDLEDDLFAGLRGTTTATG